MAGSVTGRTNEVGDVHTQKANNTLLEQMHVGDITDTTTTRSLHVAGMRFLNMQQQNPKRKDLVRMSFI